MADFRFPPSAFAVDPSGSGPAGSAYVVCVGGVYALRAWWACRPVGRHVEYADSLGRSERPESLTAARVLVATQAPAPDHLVCECTPPIGRGGPARLIVQSEGAGALVALAEARYRMTAARPLPADWRPAIRVSSDPKGTAARAAWGWADYERRLALDWQGVACAPPPAWAAEHVAEAGVMAVWALRR